MPARTNMPTCLFPALQVMGPAEKQRPIRFQGAQLLQKLRSSVSSQVAFSIPPTGFSLTTGWPRLTYKCLQPASQCRLNFSAVSIECKVLGGYPNGRVFGGQDLAMNTWEKKAGSILSFGTRRGRSSMTVCQCTIRSLSFTRALKNILRDLAR